MVWGRTSIGLKNSPFRVDAGNRGYGHDKHPVSTPSSKENLDTPSSGTDPFRAPSSLLQVLLLHSAHLALAFGRPHFALLGDWHQASQALRLAQPKQRDLILLTWPKRSLQAFLQSLLNREELTTKLANKVWDPNDVFFFPLRVCDCICLCVTVCHCVSLRVTVCHCVSLCVTVCHCVSLLLPCCFPVASLLLPCLLPCMPQSRAAES